MHLSLCAGIGTHGILHMVPYSVSMLAGLPELLLLLSPHPTPTPAFLYLILCSDRWIAGERCEKAVFGNTGGIKTRESFKNTHTKKTI